jgi:hypothetical protein
MNKECNCDNLDQDVSGYTCYKCMRGETKMNETLEALLSNEIRICELCGSNEWRILHQG